MASIYEQRNNGLNLPSLNLLARACDYDINIAPDHRQLSLQSHPGRENLGDDDG